MDAASSAFVSSCIRLHIVADDFGYVCLDKGKRELVNVVDDCNGHYNRTPDLGNGRMWWNMWDLARLFNTRREGTRSVRHLAD